MIGLEETLRKDEITQTFVAWMKKLGLLHWQRVFAFDCDIPDELEVQTEATKDYNFVGFKIGKNWRDWDKDTLEEIALHECVHLWFHQIIQASKEAEHAFGDNELAFQLYSNRVAHELEQAVDAITLSILKLQENNDLRS